MATPDADDDVVIRIPHAAVARLRGWLTARRMIGVGACCLILTGHGDRLVAIPAVKAALPSAIVDVIEAGRTLPDQCCRTAQHMQWMCSGRRGAEPVPTADSCCDLVDDLVRSCSGWYAVGATKESP